MRLPKLTKLSTLLLLTMLAFPVSSEGQSSSVQLEIFNPPQTSTQAGWSDLFTAALPEANGISAFLQWGSVDNGTSAPCVESSCNWTAIDKEFMSYIYGATYNGTPVCTNGLCNYNPHKTLNLIVVLVPEGGETSNGIPTYVFEPSTYSNWCSGCDPQDMATCGDWSGDANVPTGRANGVWNETACRLTGGGACPGTDRTDTSGYPVLYESPIMTAYQDFAKTLAKHYSSSGSGNGPTIGQYISYIRFGLASGGENLPLCTAASDTLGIWPSQKGLSGGIPDWYLTSRAAACGTQTDPIPASYPSSCVGKDAYLSNVNGTDEPGYVNTMLNFYKSIVGSRPKIVINAHQGPVADSDTIYADAEALLVKNLGAPFGFGMESLSVGDTYNAPDGCTDDWCYNFQQYAGDGLDDFLQTTTPNNEPAYTVSSISVNTSTQVATATCTTNCITGTGAIYADEWILITGNVSPVSLGTPGTNGYYKVLSNTGTAINFSVANCNNNGGDPCISGTGGTLFSGDYLPNTIPTAVKYDANTLEIYFCDWMYAFVSGKIGNCPNAPGAYTSAYASILEDPTGH
jgi:hypothetical protein